MVSDGRPPERSVEADSKEKTRRLKSKNTNIRAGSGKTMLGRKWTGCCCVVAWFDNAASTPEEVDGEERGEQGGETSQDKTCNMRCGSAETALRRHAASC